MSTPRRTSERRPSVRRPSDYVRAFGVLLAIGGAGTIGAAGRLARATSSAGGAVPDPRIIRVLGARQLAQGALVVTAPDPAITGSGVGADAAHAVSMVALAVLVPRFRRPALWSALMAGASAVVGAVLVHLQRADPR